MIMNFLKKVPAGMMIVPLLIGAILNTFCSSILQVGSLTTATFSNAGAATAMGIQLVCLGTTLRFNELGSVLKRGGVLLISKFVAGAVIGIVVGKVFGTDGFLGLSALAIICAVTNSNGSVYLSLMQSYGDEVDSGAMALLSLNDGPFFTLVAMGASGLANIPILSILAAITPIIVGMILGNLDKSFSDFLAPAGPILIPFVGLTLGAGIDLSAVIKGGPSGVLLGFMTTFIGGAFIVLCDRKISKRPGYAGWAVATTAGNAVALRRFSIMGQAFGVTPTTFSLKIAISRNRLDRKVWLRTSSSAFSEITAGSIGTSLSVSLLRQRRSCPMGTMVSKLDLMLSKVASNEISAVFNGILKSWQSGKRSHCVSSEIRFCRYRG